MSLYSQISRERCNNLIDRYHKYIANLNDPNTVPAKVFDPLGPKQLQELELIREVSRELQAKKEEDMRKAALAKEEAKKEAEAAVQEIKAESPPQEESIKE